MITEGRIDVRISRQPDGSARAAIRSSRPLALAGVLAGRPAADAVRLLPRLYAVCGVAQGAAAAAASERALGLETPAATAIARQLLVEAETLREHLVRIVRDWPGDDRADLPSLRGLLQALPELLRLTSASGPALDAGAAVRFERARVHAVIDALEAGCRDRVFGEPPARFLERLSVADLDDWCRTAATPAARTLEQVVRSGWQAAGRGSTSFLPALPDDELLPLLLDDELGQFTAAPTWHGVPRETTPYARQAERPLVRALEAEFGSGLLTRLAAQLVEVATLPASMRGLLESMSLPATAAAGGGPAGTGVAQVEAARGRLTHAVELIGDRVARYRILAPTEWNFHRDGAAARGLESLDSADRDARRRQAELLVHAIDPCVGCRVEWADA